MASPPMRKSKDAKAALSTEKQTQVAQEHSLLKM
jgi:hypothetical protein